jgi:RelE toxin of RelE / RelB toxin-antitoxin system
VKQGCGPGCGWRRLAATRCIEVFGISSLGREIPGAGGFRKARWARRGKGKSGGFRVVYFFLAEPGRIYMAAIYAKSRKETLSGADRNVLARLAAQIKKAAKGGRSPWVCAI